MACVIAFIALVTSTAGIVAHQRARASQADFDERKNILAAAPIRATGSPANVGAFDGTQLMTLLHASADAVEVDLDELVYTLEEAPSEPFLRYRARFGVTASYPDVKRFVDKVLNSAPNLSLDKLSCIKQTIQEDFPTCDLAVSALYTRDAIE